MSYRYQMHTHTSPCSRCARMTPEELCDALHKGGYAGAILTNHFRHGNTGIDRALPWEEFVVAYEKDLVACRAAAKAYDLDILFGLEEGVGGGLEILCYGLTPDVLYRHPELKDGKIALWSEVMHSEGVLVLQAHPYRERAYISSPGPLPLTYLDGIEIHNYGNDEECNRKAAALAEAHPELITVSGADTHSAATVTNGGIVTAYRLSDEKTLADTLRARDFRPILP